LLDVACFTLETGAKFAYLLVDMLKCPT
jgi:hypothetical protein